MSPTCPGESNVPEPDERNENSTVELKTRDVLADTDPSFPLTAVPAPTAPGSYLQNNPNSETLSSAPPHGPAELPPPIPVVIDVDDLDWCAVRSRIDIRGIRSRMSGTIVQMENLLSQTAGAEMLFDSDRTCRADKAIQVSHVDNNQPLWIIGDLHGDLLALESALMLFRGHVKHSSVRSRIVFLGDLFDDEGFGLEVLLRVFEIILEDPSLICVLAGNHDEALGHDGTRFVSTVSPSDFSDFLNTQAEDEWIERAGKLTIKFFLSAPRALFFPDGLLIAHGGFPLTDLHSRLRASADWNDPACLSDFVWTRAHPTARKKLANRFSRGSQYGYEDFAAFCNLAADLGRPVTHMVRGHDHVEERFAIYPNYGAHPLLTTVALSRRLPREFLGKYECVPSVALYTEGQVPQVFRLHIPPDLIRSIYPEPVDSQNGDLEGNLGTAE